MARDPLKAPFACPECGFVQQESKYLISTCCRACGTFYDVKSAQQVAVAPTRSAPRLVRKVHCHRCGEEHEVSSHAQSTMCPGCNQSIEFADLNFSGNVSRPVDTRGKVVVEASGHLNSAMTVCGEALIWGKISGALHCEGPVRLHSTGKLGCRITAGRVIVEKGARLEFLYPVDTGTLEVFGHVFGTFECHGSVHVRKGGLLEGRFHSRSIMVDQGGALLAESLVDPAPEDDDEP